MTPTEYKKIAEAFATGDFAYASAYFAVDVTWDILGEEPVSGKDKVLEVASMQQLQSFPVITILNVVGEGDVVVVESTGKATTKQGQPYNQRYCDVYRFKDGKLQQITTYLDTALVARS